LVRPFSLRVLRSLHPTATTPSFISPFQVVFAVVAIAAAPHARMVSAVSRIGLAY